MVAINIETWLMRKIADDTGVPIEKVSCDVAFDSFALDSLSLISLAYDLETLLGKEINPAVFTEYNTINKLAGWVKSNE